MITQERLKELLSYDQDTGVFIWCVSPARNVKAGRKAGWLDRLGYLRINLDEKSYLAHRLAWLYVHGQFPVFQIDHINRCPSDNRIANIRDVPQSSNMLNSRMKSNNTSGINGVGWNKANGNWIASFRKKYIGSSRIRAVAESMRFAAEIVHGGMRPTD